MYFIHQKTKLGDMGSPINGDSWSEPVKNDKISSILTSTVPSV